MLPTRTIVARVLTSQNQAPVSQQKLIFQQIRHLSWEDGTKMSDEEYNGAGDKKVFLQHDLILLEAFKPYFPRAPPREKEVGQATFCGENLSEEVTVGAHFAQT